ncbi:MAG: acetyl-CoA decarbonylase/synthase complex subunit gamma [Anaerolineae bacterium]|nr:acetyl-CoA decarbonylase/synthase complex subunit gamma [Anaerolineae bacterium]
MALTGIQIYKLLPQTNCKDCGYPTCLAFAMKLAAKQEEPEKCPHLSDEAKDTLMAAARPPVQLVALKSDGYQAQAGGETVMHRHEKRFFNKPGLLLRVYDSEPADAIKAKVAEAEAFVVDYVGMDLVVDGFVVQADGGDFAAAVSAVRASSKRPLVLAGAPEALKAGLAQLGEDETPMLCCANADNWEAMAALAKAHHAALAVEAGTVDDMVALVQKVEGAGVESVVLAPKQRTMHGMVIANTVIRRMALKKNFRPFGYPILSFPGDVGDPDREAALAATAIAKYGGFIVLDHFDPAAWYPLLVMRENLYTDPQKPIQVTAGPVRDQQPRPRRPGADDDQLQHHVLRRRQRG